jgi:hypothetical protein
VRTQTYKRYLDRMRDLCAVEDLLDTEKAQFLGYFQRNIRFAWENYEWPELCPTEELVPDGDRIIPLEGASNQDIGEVFAVWDGDPDGDCRPREIGFTITPDGLKLSRECDPVWVYFKARVPDYYGEDWDEDAAYERDDQTYNPTTGRFYRALVASTGHATTEEAYWEELEIPYSLFEYVVQASYADALRGSGFSEKSAVQMQMAGALLVQEIEKVSRQQRQRLRHNTTRTHGTTQFRNPTRTY